MSAHGPDERLSAFYDGELSAAERAEVERLLAESPQLRGELNAWTDLSQRLSDLADDLPPFDLRPGILQQLSAAKSSVPRPLVTPDRAVRRRWLPVILAVSSLALLVAVMFPLLPKPQTLPTVASHDKSGEMADVETATSFDAPMAVQSMPAPMAASPAPGPAFASKETSIAGAMKAEEAGVAENGQDGFQNAEDLDSPILDGTGPSEFLANLDRRRELQPGDIVSQLVETSNGLWMVDLTVVDIHRGTEEVEVLLKNNGIVPIPQERDNPEKDNHKSDDTDAARRENSQAVVRDQFINVILVDSEVNALNNAINDSQNLQDVVAWRYEPIGPLGVESFDSGEAVTSDESPEAAFDTKADTQIKAKESPSRLANSDSPAEPPVIASKAAPVANGPTNDIPDLERAENHSQKKSMQRRGPTDPSQMTTAPRDTANEEALSSNKPGYLGVNGNSFQLPRGPEIVAELQQLQKKPELLKNRLAPRGSGFQAGNGRQFGGGGGSPTRSTSPNSNARSGDNNDAFSKIQRPEIPSQNAAVPFEQVYNTPYNYRGRQRAVLVLRSQPVPPPPPEPSRAEP